MLKILIADDHPVVREGLRHILAGDSGKCIFDYCESYEEILNKIEKNNYDLLFLEINLLGYKGLSAIEKIKKRANLAIIVLTLLPEELFAIRTLKNGASAFISKGSPPGELILAFERVLAGKKYIGPGLAEKIADRLTVESDVTPEEKLSNREFQIMQMIASGEELRNIAQELSLSPRTVSTYRKRILKKMNLKNNAALSVYAIKNKLIKEF